MLKDQDLEAERLEKLGAHKELYPLHHAVYRGDLEYVREQLTQNPKLIDTKDGTKMNLLHVACWIGDTNEAYYEEDIQFSTEKSLAMIKFLLDQGIDPIEEDNFGDTALLKVGYKGPIEGINKTKIAGALLDSRATEEEKSALLNHQGGGSKKYPLFEAAFYRDSDLFDYYASRPEVKLLLPCTNGDTSISHLVLGLHSPIEKKMCLKFIEKLPSASDISKEELGLLQKAFHTAVYLGAIDVIEKLLEKGCSFETPQEKVVSYTDDWRPITNPEYPLEKAELSAKLVDILQSGLLKTAGSLVFDGINLFRNVKVRDEVIKFIKDTSTGLKKVVIKAEGDLIDDFREDKETNDDFVKAEKMLIEALSSNTNITELEFYGFDSNLWGDTTDAF